jgi:ferredoxin
MDDLSDALAAYGLERTNIHTEAFGAHAAIAPGIAGAPATPPHQPDDAPGRGPLVQFARSAISAQWDPAYGSLLAFAEACDVPTQWSCRTGVCHTCETAVLSGKVAYEFPPLDPPADGNTLLCIATPSEAVVLDL